MPVLMISNEESARVRKQKRFTTSLVVVFSASLVALLLGGCGQSSQPVPQPTSEPQVTPMPTLDASAVTLGQQVYAEYCASCHGIEGEGQQNWKEPLPNGNYPAPPHDDSGHTWHHGDGTLYRVVHEGSMARRQGITPGMPAFADVLTDKEIRATILYLKSIWSEETQQIQWEQSQRDPFPGQ